MDIVMVIIIALSLMGLFIATYLIGKEKGRADRYKQLYRDLSKENAWLLSKLKGMKEKEQ